MNRGKIWFMTTLQVQKISREVVIDPSETTRRAPSEGEIKAYLQGALHDASLNKGRRYRGFFDAEGGIPRKENATFYIQLVQKNKPKLERLKEILLQAGIASGKIHNPSVRVDPEYWRFFIATRSHKEFATLIGSWHPRKSEIFKRRMVI